MAVSYRQNCTLTTRHFARVFYLEKPLSDDRASSDIRAVALLTSIRSEKLRLVELELGQALTHKLLLDAYIECLGESRGIRFSQSVTVRIAMSGRSSCNARRTALSILLSAQMSARALQSSR